MQNRIPAETEIGAWFKQYSNWGRWGADDRLGTLNHITPAKRAAAAASVKDGVTVSCGWDVIMNSPQPGLELEPQRLMLRTGLGHSHAGQTVPLDTPRSSDGSIGTAAESVSMMFHGRAVTHVDALAHVFWKGQIYGGLSSDFITDRDGATRHDIRSAANGIQTRGVLLDIAAAHGVDRLDTRVAVVPEDLEAAESLTGVRVQTGDALLVRTGDGQRRIDGSWNPEQDGQPGLHASCIPWLYEREVAAIGADVPQEIIPSGYAGFTLPVHAVGIVAMGLWLIDNCQLEDLARACTTYDRSHFLFTVAPLRLDGGTGSPVNPLALF
jgi:kynurenine formamidase